MSSTALAALMGERDRCRWVWNECCAKSKQTRVWNKSRLEGEDKRTCGPAQLDKMLTEARKGNTWLREGSSVPQQQLIRDFAKSRAKAQKDVKDCLPVRQRAGMPKWKKKREALPSLNYTSWLPLEGRAPVPGGRHRADGGVVSRPSPDASSVRVHQDSIGHWYASFVVPAVVEPLRETGRVIGIDWGVKETATTTSDDHDLPHAEHGKSAAQKPARYQRMMARRRPPKGKPGSKGYRRAKKRVAKLHKKVARRRQDTTRNGTRAHPGDRGLPPRLIAGLLPGVDSKQLACAP
ncbi:transposase [Streptomyces sp. NPDC051211]|uniref:RNA-guided endonuclease InsQ/TnpB family protein n=1 Tax=Streptomyces sp. NPDC051211 TaxID=3154643 RepID=UPI00344C5075